VTKTVLIGVRTLSGYFPIPTIYLSFFGLGQAQGLLKSAVKTGQSKEARLAQVRRSWTLILPPRIYDTH
jgi:hypothetical protein